MSMDENWSSKYLSVHDSGSFEPQNSTEGGVSPSKLVVSSGNTGDVNNHSPERLFICTGGSRSSEPPLNSEEDSKGNPQQIISSESDDGSSQRLLSASCDERSSVPQNSQGDGSFWHPTSLSIDNDRSSSIHPLSPSSRQISSGGNSIGIDSTSTSLDNCNVCTEPVLLSDSGNSRPRSFADSESPPVISPGSSGSIFYNCCSTTGCGTSPHVSSVDVSPSISRNGDPILGGLSVVPTFEDADFFIQPEDVQLSEEIGVGAFSRVYVGMYMGELVAVKKQKWVGEKNMEIYLLRELAVLKHFEHPNLLRYIGASKVEASAYNERHSHEEVIEDSKDEKTDNGDDEEGDNGSYVYIVTELAVHGDFLVLIMGDAPLGWCLRCNILMDTARALEFLHNRSLIHRDVKSANMILCDGYTCKLADFGMARQLGSDMSVVGTDAYMAPELMFDEPYDGAADMFSFGMVVWECIHRRKAGADGWAERRPNDKFQLDQADLVATAPKDTPRSIIMLAQQLCSYEPEGRPSAEDTSLWLEDLIHEMERDEIKPPVPIDYMHIFKNGIASSPVCQGSSYSTSNQVDSETMCNNSSDSRGGGGSAQVMPSVVIGYDSHTRQDQPPDLGTSTLTVELTANNRGDDNTRVVSPRQQHSDFSVRTTVTQVRESSCAAVKTEEVQLSSICRPSHRSNSLNTPPYCPDLKDEHLREGYLVTGATEPMHNSPSGVQGTSRMPITCRGFLYKKGKSGLRNWQKRWFVLEGSKLVWYKNIDGYPWEPRGFLELRGCFLVRGLYFQWKILSADSEADQEEYNRELAALHVDDMEMWLKALQAAIDDADAVRDGPHDKLNKGSSRSLSDTKYRVTHSDSDQQYSKQHQRILSRETSSFRYNLTVGGWLNQLGVPELLPSFQKEGYTDLLLSMELGLRDDDLDAIGLRDPHIRKALKMKMPGFKTIVLSAEITGYFDFGKEIVYKVESQWGYNRSCTFFTFQDLEELHRKLREATKEPKHYRLVPSFPAKHFAAARGRKLGTMDHATTLARRQTSLNKYLQKLIELVRFKEPYFTIICVALKVSQGSV